jgi:hypothetical protein
VSEEASLARGSGDSTRQAQLARVFVFLLLFAVPPERVFAQACANHPDETIRGEYLGQERPGSSPQLFAPGIVSTCTEHSAAMFTPAGDEVYFGRMFPAAIHYMRRVDGEWSRPEAASNLDLWVAERRTVTTGNW